MPGILWLASYPKSGNTWVRAFLANYLFDGEGPAAINDLEKWISGDGAAEYFTKAAGGPVAHLSDRGIHMLRPKVHEMLARSREDTVFVKTHNQIAFLDGVPTINPAATAGAIYIIRNPLDVCVSYAHHYAIGLGDAVLALRSPDTRITTGGPHVLQYMGSWSRHVLSWTTAPGMRLHAVRYEDLALKPAETYRRLTGFLGLPHDERRLRKAVRFSSFRELSRQEEKGGFVECNEERLFFRKGRVGDWRNALSPEQARTIVSDHRQVMAKFGYLTRNGTPVF